MRKVRKVIFVMWLDQDKLAALLLLCRLRKSPFSFHKVEKVKAGRE